MSRDTTAIAALISSWILGEVDPWRKMAYIIANTYYDTRDLREYLRSLIQGGDTPGAKQLKEQLTDQDMQALWDDGLAEPIWGIVADNLCKVIGRELQVSEHDHLRGSLAQREQSARKDIDPLLRGEA